MTLLQKILLFFVILNACILFVLTVSFQKNVFAQTPATLPSATACTFTRGDQNPKAAPYSSPLLLSYFQQAAQKTGVPAAVLAAIARVESTTGTYSISNYTDDDVRAMEQAAKSGNFDGTIPGTQKALCPKSPTGARGIMQIQPPGTTGNASEAIENGAHFLGKTADQLTLQDYCDPKTEMIIAAGFILKKMQGWKFGDGTKWDPSWNTNKKAFDAVAESYYGCLIYGDPARPNDCVGPYSYGDDIWQSFQDCGQTFSSPITVPPSSNSSGGGSGTAASNEVITLVGNPPLASGSGGISPEGRIFYCQGNPAWSGQGCLGSAGCGVTSIAMLVSSFGIAMTPLDVLQEFQKHPGWYSCDGSVMTGAILPSAWLKDLGFTVAPICDNCGKNLNTALMKEYADKGYLFIASSITWPCANCKGGLATVNHIVMIEGVDPQTNTVLVRDPNNCDYANGQEFSTNRTKDAGAINWYYVYALKKTQ